MSCYTDNEHKKGINATLYWQANPPKTAVEFFLYGEYCYHLYDFREALTAYKYAAEDEVGALFQLAYCVLHGYGTPVNKENATKYFKLLLEKTNEKEARHCYYRGMCFCYGYGTIKDEEHAWSLFATCSEKIESTLYEQGLFFLEGKIFAKDIANAVFYLRKAYDLGEERAIFAMEKLFSIYEKPYPDHIELTQAYAWRLGRILRAAEKSPCREYYLRLSACYRHGFPNDSQDNKKKFLRLADKYQNLAETLPL